MKIRIISANSDQYVWPNPMPDNLDETDCENSLPEDTKVPPTEPAIDTDEPAAASQLGDFEATVQSAAHVINIDDMEDLPDPEYTVSDSDIDNNEIGDEDTEPHIFEDPDINRIMNGLQDVLDHEEKIISALTEDKSILEMNNRLYEETRRFHEGLVEKTNNSMANEIIQTIRDLQQVIDRIPEEATPENYTKLKNQLSSIPLRLEDILYDHDIEPFTGEGETFDAKTQTAVATIQTDLPALRNVVAEHRQPGYIRRETLGDGTIKTYVLKKERVVVYKYIETT